MMNVAILSINALSAFIWLPFYGRDTKSSCAPRCVVKNNDREKRDCDNKHCTYHHVHGPPLTRSLAEASEAVSRFSRLQDGLPIVHGLVVADSLDLRRTNVATTLDTKRRLEDVYDAPDGHHDKECEDTVDHDCDSLLALLL